MKRTLLIISGVAVVIFLIVRMIVTKSNEEDDSHREFVSKLNYDLSARIDSVTLFDKHASVGFLYVTVTRGQFENNEKKISRSLKKNQRFRFMVVREDNIIRIFSRDAIKYKAGDSLIIDSAEDQLLLFREGQQVAEFVISKNLGG